MCTFYGNYYVHLCVYIIISLFKVDKHTKRRKKKKNLKKIDVNLEHREHLATTQNKKKKKSIVLIKVN